MPQLASAIERDLFLRTLIMGPPKVGKSTTIISTAPGPAYIINCDDTQTALAGAARLMKVNGAAGNKTPPFEWDLCRSYQQMLVCHRNAKEGVAAGKYKTIILDTLSSFATKLEEECLNASDTTGKGPDGRRAYPDYERRLRHLMESFFHIPAHFIAISHFLQIGGEVADNGTAKSGEGIVPLLAGKARATLPMMFNDVIFMDMVRGERLFVVNAQGSWGPGSRSLSTSEKLPADIGVLLKAIDSQAKSDANGSSKDVIPVGVRPTSTRVVAKRPLVSNPSNPNNK